MAEPSFCRFNMRNRMKIWMAFLLLASTTVWGQTKTLFFMSNGAASVRSFEKIDFNLEWGRIFRSARRLSPGGFRKAYS